MLIFHHNIFIILIFQLLKDEEMEKTLSCLVMSHDDSSGIIKVDPSCDGIFIEWEDAGRQKSFEKVDERLLEVTTALGGTYVVNPIWTEFLDKKVVTVHPLGGCPMAEDGKNGAVNHKGQVFAGI
jgi:cholesterol oxidase